MMVYPNINPIAFSLGPLHVHWYGIMYLIAFLGAYLLARLRTTRYHLPWNKEQISDLIFYLAMGAIIGGRVGYMLFYNTFQLFHAPWKIIAIWEGGMSFHGGLLGVFFALLLFAHKTKKRFWDIADFVAPLVPFGLGAGRLGNFINGELWGRPTDMPWAMIFPSSGDGVPRHPSQLYELGLEGVVLFILVWWYAAKPRPAGCVSAIFLIGYAISRLLIECFREPDRDIGFLAWNVLTMGQLLSIPMLIIGLLLWWKKHNENIPSAS